MATVDVKGLKCHKISVVTSEIWSPRSSTVVLLNAGTDRAGPEDPFPSSTISRRGVARLRTRLAAYDVIVDSTSQRFGSRCDRQSIYTAVL